jgi:DtxR family transcriptional regulator, Mn-dependent transcriptional regulator
MIPPLSGSQEDYLEAIHRIAERKSTVRVCDIAAALAVTLPSVTGALKTLERRDLVRHARYDGVELTDEGRRIAEAVNARHCVLREFLVRVLGCEPEAAERDACLMEHAVSPETIERFVRFLRFGSFVRPLKGVRRERR